MSKTTTALAKRPEPKKRPRTRPLPGLDDVRVEEIRDAALEYADLRDQRSSVGKREKAAQEKLIAIMHDHKLRRYFDAEAQLLVEIEETGEKLRVRIGPESEKGG